MSDNTFCPFCKSENSIIVVQDETELPITFVGILKEYISRDTFQTCLNFYEYVIHFEKLEYIFENERDISSIWKKIFMNRAYEYIINVKNHRVLSQSHIISITTDKNVHNERLKFICYLLKVAEHTRKISRLIRFNPSITNEVCINCKHCFKNIRNAKRLVKYYFEDWETKYRSWSLKPPYQKHAEEKLSEEETEEKRIQRLAQKIWDESCK